MEHKKLPDEILSDDVVQFISERHHTSAQSIIDSYAAQGAEQEPQGKAAVSLEDNEVQIIHDLIDMYDHKHK